MATELTDDGLAGPRGPAEHAIREQIIHAANAHFKHYGYSKTTVSDLAKAIGFSKAYIYKFFDSKQAIGQVICENRLALIIAEAHESIRDSHSATDKFRRVFKSLVKSGCTLFFDDRKLYDLAAAAASEPWPSVRDYEDQIQKLVSQIVVEGREAGEFERKTPLDETAMGIFLVMKPYMNPLLLQHNLDGVMDATASLSSLVLRSLAP